MSRFENLEFHHDEHGDARQQPAKGEEFFLAEARGAFERAEFEHALRHFSKVLEFNPRRAAAWTGQVRALIELGEFNEAKLWADKALEQFPNEAELLAAKGVALARTGDTDEAIACSDSAIQERGDTPYVWIARGDVLLARKERRADYCFEKALTLSPRDWFIAWLGARVRYFYQQFTLALKLAQQAVEWNPTHGPLWLQLGLCQKQLGMVHPARISLEQARQLLPRSQEVERTMGELANAGLWTQLSAGWKSLFRR